MEEHKDIEFNAESFNRSILSWRQTCCSAAISAKFYYQRALLLAPWQANIYTDIAVSLGLIDCLSNSSGQGLITWYDFCMSLFSNGSCHIYFLLKLPFLYQAASREDGFRGLIT